MQYEVEPRDAVAFEAQIVGRYGTAEQKVLHYRGELSRSEILDVVDEFLFGALPFDRPQPLSAERWRWTSGKWEIASPFVNLIFLDSLNEKQKAFAHAVAIATAHLIPSLPRNSKICVLPLIRDAHYAVYITQRGNDYSFCCSHRFEVMVEVTVHEERYRRSFVAPGISDENFSSFAAAEAGHPR